MPNLDVATSPIAEISRDYARFVNPQWVRLMDTLEMNVAYAHCEGAELTAEDGRKILDFLSGYCVYNAGHNHPGILAAVRDEIDRRGPTMLQSHVPPLAGELAKRLCRSAGGRLDRVLFCSSGSEGIDAAVKFARAFTRRPGILYAAGGFHGLTCTSLSLMSDPFWRKDFGPFLTDTLSVRFNDLADLEKALRTKRYAAFIVEPIQAEAGIRMPEGGYLKEAERLCRRYGTLFVLDEVQTGMYRTGRFLAAHHYGVEPDMVVLAKALSGGLIPVGALLMSEPVCRAVFDSIRHAMIHASTFGENGLAMRAGLASMDVLESDGLGVQAVALGEYLRNRLTAALAPYEMFCEIRGLGLLSGVEFKAPSQLRLRLPYEAFRRVHEGVFGQILVMRLFKNKSVLTQICGNQFMVLKAAPPIIVTRAQIDRFVDAMSEQIAEIHASDGYWSDALALLGRAVKMGL